MDRPAVVFALLLLLSGFVSQGESLSGKADQAKMRNEAFVEGSGGWRFLPAELRFVEKLASPDLASEVEPAIQAIVDFSSQLKSAGISLVVVPVPPKALVHGAELQLKGEEEQKMRQGWLEIMNALSSQGVDIIDLLGDYSSAPEPAFCQRDTHWSGPGIALAVEKLAAMLRSAGLEPLFSAGKRPWEETPIRGDLGGDGESVKLRFAKDTGTEDQKSPVLLLGDSHVLVFHQGGDLHATGAGLPAELADLLGATPEVLGVRGSGATSSRLALARRMRSDPSYLSGKKAVVWCFAGREFTEADMWKKTPIFAAKQK